MEESVLKTFIYSLFLMVVFWCHGKQNDCWRIEIKYH